MAICSNRPFCRFSKPVVRRESKIPIINLEKVELTKIILIKMRFTFLRNRLLRMTYKSMSSAAISLEEFFFISDSVVFSIKNFNTQYGGV